MSGSESPCLGGLAELRRAVAELLLAEPLLASALPARASRRPGGAPPSGGSPGLTYDDADRLKALVDLARGGDAEAFGALYDHYSPEIFRLIYHRVGSADLAEDLLSDTFFRALRAMGGFTWQGKDFGAWLTTIARNLITDHYKSRRVRQERLTSDFATAEESTSGPEDEVLAGLTSDLVRRALHQLPGDQQECLVLRFLNGASIAETAQALGRSEGAVKQLQLRALRNLAKLLPEGVR